MLNKRNEIKAILENFSDKCENKKIWYSLDDTSLLGAIRHGGFVPWEEKMQVMMTIKSYAKLKREFPQNVADSSFKKELRNLCGYFVKDINDLKSDQAFIEIRILVPTTIKKFQNLKSNKYLLSSLWKSEEINTKKIINDLKDKDFEIYGLVKNRKYDVYNSWIQSISFQTVSKSFNGLNIQVIKEYEKILKSWYGENFMIAKIPDFQNNYISPTLTKEEVL